MGTRADFYVGEGESAEWLGSVAWDGYAWAESAEAGKGGLAAATDEQTFRAEVAKLAGRRDFSKPDDGWPWPWATSKTTDFAYCFTSGTVRIYSFGEDVKDDRQGSFPDMSKRQNVTFGERSGVIFVKRN